MAARAVLLRIERTVSHTSDCPIPGPKWDSRNHPPSPAGVHGFQWGIPDTRHPGIQA